MEQTSRMPLVALALIAKDGKRQNDPTWKDVPVRDIHCIDLKFEDTLTARPSGDFAVNTGASTRK
jgi:hypothetical protein